MRSRTASTVRWAGGFLIILFSWSTSCADYTAKKNVVYEMPAVVPT